MTAKIMLSTSRLPSQLNEVILPAQGDIFGRILSETFLAFSKKARFWKGEKNSKAKGQIYELSNDDNWDEKYDPDVVELCAPKQAPGRWRGKGVSKTEYQESGMKGNVVLFPDKNGDGKKDDEDGDDEQQEARGSGNDGDGNDNDPTQDSGAAVNQVDSRVCYGYLFDKDEAPTMMLDAMLRRIAKHIVCALELSE
jgi:hypothetical protein